MFSYLFASLYRRIITPNLKYISETLIPFLCKTTITIEWCTSMINRLTKQGSLWMNMSRLKRFQNRKLKSLSIKRTRKPCKIFMKRFITIVKVDKSLGLLMVMMHLMVVRSSNFLMRFIIRKNWLFFTAILSKSLTIPSQILDSVTKLPHNIFNQGNCVLLQLLYARISWLFTLICSRWQKNRISHTRTGLSLTTHMIVRLSHPYLSCHIPEIITCPKWFTNTDMTRA